MKKLLIMVALLSTNGILHASNFDDQETSSTPPTRLHIVLNAIEEAAPPVMVCAGIIAAAGTIAWMLSVFGGYGILVQK